MPDNNTISPMPLGDDELIEYYKRKLPDWHARLRQQEDETKEMREAFKEVATQMKEVHVAILGTTDGEKRGILRRLEIVEGWKKTASWILGIVFIAIIGVVTDIVIRGIRG